MYKRVKQGKMKRSKPERTSIHCNDSYEGESIEQKMRRVRMQNAPIEETGQGIWPEGTEVLPLHDVRTDRFDLALDAANNTERVNMARSESAPEMQEGGGEVGTGNGEQAPPDANK